jgi:hypothetical protein
MPHRLLFLSFLLCCLQSAPVSAAPLPNVVILYADDMGYGDLGANFSFLSSVSSMLECPQNAYMSCVLRKPQPSINFA